MSLENQATLVEDLGMQVTLFMTVLLTVIVARKGSYRVSEAVMSQKMF